MSIEKNIERIADALEAIAKGDAAGQIATALEKLLAGAPAAAPADKPASAGSQRQRKNVEREDKPEPQPEPEPDPLDAPDPLDDAPAAEPEEKFSEDDVRKALKAWRDINGADALTALLKKYGATGMGSLKPADYPALMKEVR